MRWVVVAALVVSCGVGLADELPRDTNEIKTLTVEQAEALAKHKGELWLSGLNTITPEVAEALAKCEGGLWLDNLTELTPAAAKALAESPRVVVGPLLNKSARAVLEKYPSVEFSKGMIGGGMF